MAERYAGGCWEAKRRRGEEKKWRRDDVLGQVGLKLLLLRAAADLLEECDRYFQVAGTMEAGNNSVCFI